MVTDLRLMEIKMVTEIVFVNMWKYLSPFLSTLLQIRGYSMFTLNCFGTPGFSCFDGFIVLNMY